LDIIDIILIVTVVLFVWLGYKRGFVNSFFQLVQWAGAFAVAVLLYTHIAQLVDKYFSVSEEWQKPLSFLLLFITTVLVLSMLFMLLKKKLAPETQFSYVNKIAGLIPGFLTGTVVAVLLAKVFVVSVWYTEPGKAGNSILVASINDATGWVDANMEAVFNTTGQSRVSGSFETAYSASEEFKSETFTARPDLELLMLRMVNAEREKTGLQILVPDDKLQLAAQQHAADMFGRGYFSHNTPEGINPFERMRKMGIKYAYAGENLAHSFNLDEAHSGLMNSPGHRANILNKKFGKVGISILDSDINGLMLVQEFSN
jgi:uncharacterized protein YkwD